VADDERWALDQLGPGETELWHRLSDPDRCHAVDVARAVVVELGEPIDRPVVAAALLHDSGKVVSRLGTFSRVIATLVWAAVDDARAEGWSTSDRVVTRRLGQYRRHPELGAELLRAAGSDPLTVAWAAEHHLPPDRWTIPIEIGQALKACDDD
jgi:hypothetical protein